MRTKDLWIIHLGTLAVALLICVATLAQPLLTVLLFGQWLIAGFTISVLLTVLTLIPGQPIRNPLAHLGVWIIGLALSGPAAWLANAALAPLLGLQDTTTNWAYYLWVLPLLGLYAISTAALALARRLHTHPRPTRPAASCTTGTGGIA